MQSNKKHKKEKKHKISASEFAKGFTNSMGGKEQALIKAKLLEQAAKTAPEPKVDTINFWTNIVGHILKVGV
jgi:hypothetical protein